MRKDVRCFLILVRPLLIAFCFVILWVPQSWSSAFDEGKFFYRQQKYSQAVQKLTIASRQDPSNPEVFFALGLAYAQNLQLAQAKSAFEAVLKLTPLASPLGQKAYKNMGIVSRAMMSSQGNEAKANQIAGVLKKTGDNYLGSTISAGKIVHWELSRMPLLVYVGSGAGVDGWSQDMQASVYSGIREWEAATNYKIRFKQVRDPGQANIKIRWQRNFNHGKVGENPFESIGDTIVRSDVTIATHIDPNGPVLNSSEIKQIATHEIGHALGLQGHSPYEGDIMYYMMNPAQSGVPTARDKKTVALLYRIQADVTNNTVGSTAQASQFYDNLKQAEKKVGSSDLQSAIVDYQKALKLKPNSPDLLYNIGVAYSKLKQNDQAMNYYRKALAVDPNYTRAKYNLSVHLINQGAEWGNQRRSADAKQAFTEAIQLLEQVERSPNPPQGVQENLQAAQRNLSLVGP